MGCGRPDEGGLPDVRSSNEGLLDTRSPGGSGPWPPGSRPAFFRSKAREFARMETSRKRDLTLARGLRDQPGGQGLALGAVPRRRPVPRPTRRSMAAVAAVFRCMTSSIRAGVGRGQLPLDGQPGR